MVKHRQMHEHRREQRTHEKNEAQRPQNGKTQGSKEIHMKRPAGEHGKQVKRELAPLAPQVFYAVNHEPEHDEIRQHEKINVAVDPGIIKIGRFLAGDVGINVVLDDMTMVPPEVGLRRPEIREKIGPNFVERRRFEVGQVAGLMRAGNGDAGVRVRKDDHADDTVRQSRPGEKKKTEGKQSDAQQKHGRFIAVQA